VAGFLPGSPAADDAALMTSELVTNAVMYSASGLPGGAQVLDQTEARGAEMARAARLNAESTGPADLQREREARYKKDRERWQAKLREYQGARHRPIVTSDGWLSLDDDDEWDAMLVSRWAVLGASPGSGSLAARAVGPALR
jgi:hypothetical protein